MAMWRKHFPQRGTDLAATPALAVCMTMSVDCALVVCLVCGVRLGIVGHARRPFGRAGFDSALMMVPGCNFASSALSR